MQAASTTEQMDRLESKLDAILAQLLNPVEIRAAYTIEEVSDKIGISRNTIRIWCRHGRINATRRSEKSGGVELWSISSAELTRYRDEGLLPLEPSRNAR